MGELVHQAMEELGIEVRTDTSVTGFDTNGDGRIRSVRTTDGVVSADVVVLASGSDPTRPWPTSRAALGDHGGIPTDMQVWVLGHIQVLRAASV